MLSVSRHSLIYLIDISYFTSVQGTSRNREIEISIFTDDVILGGGGLGAWWRLMTRGEGVENGLKIDDVIYGWPQFYVQGEKIGNETRNLEFKSGQGHVESHLGELVGKYMSAFLNGERGTLMIGVNDAGRLFTFNGTPSCILEGSLSLASYCSIMLSTVYLEANYPGFGTIEVLAESSGCLIKARFQSLMLRLHDPTGRSDSCVNHTICPRVERTFAFINYTVKLLIQLVESTSAVESTRMTLNHVLDCWFNC